ncbi:MAG TPA: VOC family protein [Acidisphaera sp.]|nr:VOC family protein [Acidisphaera sp.]
MPTNRFVWYELVTSDIDAALTFYGQLLGWTPREFPGGDSRYVVVSADGRDVAGIMALPEGMSQPFWLGYVGTPDMDAAAARFTGAGGVVHRGPWDVPTIGRLALVSDKQGVGLALFQPADAGRQSTAFHQGLPGHGNWHELHTPDPEAAFAFYADQFGWTKGDAMDMGPMGKYQILKADDAQMGGMMKAQEPMRPMWLYYFGVRGINDAVARVRDNGGTVLHGPSEVPGGAHIISATDPQGAMFALVGPG